MSARSQISPGWSGLSAVQRQAYLRQLAFHEAGHIVLWSAFGVPADAELSFDAADEVICAMAFPTVPARLSPSQDASVSWAGIMAEHLPGFCLEPSPSVPGLQRSEAVAEFSRYVLANRWWMLSPTDRTSILGAPDIVRAATWTFLALTSPIGSSLLNKWSRKLLEAMRRQVRERAPASNPLSAAADRLAERLVDGAIGVDALLNPGRVLFAADACSLDL